MIRKVMTSITVLTLLFILLGCVDYKTPANNDDARLVDEIAAIENQLKNGPTEPIVEEEEVILPQLDEEPQDFVTEEDLETITVQENDQVKLNVKVSDPDQDTVTYTFSKPLNTLGEWKTNYGDAGEYIVTISATDGKLTTEKRVKIVVQRVNVPPVIEALADLMVEEGDEVSFQPKVSDPNNDKVTVSISEPLKSGTFNTDHTSAGEYQVRVVASDGELNAEKTFRLTVTDVNVPPEMSGLEDVAVKEGETVRVKPTVSDLDGDTVQVTISEPVGNDGVWETSYTDHGEYVVTVTATDGKDTVMKKVMVTVEDVNKAPEIVDVYVNKG